MHRNTVSIALIKCLWLPLLQPVLHSPIAFGETFHKPRPFDAPDIAGSSPLRHPIERHCHNSAPPMEEPEVCGSYDWIADYGVLRPFFTPEFLGLGRDARVLVVGCGTSTLSASLHADGFCSVVSADIDAAQVGHSRAPAAAAVGVFLVATR